MFKEWEVYPIKEKKWKSEAENKWVHKKILSSRKMKGKKAVLSRWDLRLYLTKIDKKKSFS